MKQLPVPEPIKGHLHHRMVGRTRLVLDPPLPSHEALQRLAEALASTPGIDAVEIRPTTGSVILRHKGEFGPIAGAVTAAGLVVTVAPPAEPLDPIQEVRQGLAQADTAVAQATGGRADLWGVAFVGLLGIGLVQLARGRVAGPALTVLTQAATLAMMRPFRMPKR